MSRELNQAAIDALAGDSVELALLLTIDAAEVGGESPLDRPLRLTDRPGGIVDTTVDPTVTYFTSNTLRLVGPVRETLEPRSSDIKLTFTATDSVIGLYLNLNPARWRVELRLAVLNDAGRVTDVALLFSGYGSGVRVRGKPDRPDVELTAASHWASFEVTGGRETNSRSQAQEFPGDRVFDLAFSQVRDFSWAQRVALDAEKNAVHALPVIYGRRKVEALPVFQALGGRSKRYLYMVFALAEGPVEEVSDIWIDDKPLFVWNRWAQYEGYTGPNTPWASGNDPDSRAVIRFYPGADDQPADPWFASMVPGWTANHRGQGVALLYCRFAYDRDLFSGVPTIHALVKGRKVLNVQDLTEPPSWSPSFADQLYDYLTSTRYGRGIPADEINVDSFAAAKSLMYKHNLKFKAMPIGQVLATERVGGNWIVTTDTSQRFDVAAGSHRVFVGEDHYGLLISMTQNSEEIISGEPGLGDGTGLPAGVWSQTDTRRHLTVRHRRPFRVGDNLRLVCRYRRESHWTIDTSQKILDVIKQGLASAGCWLTWRGGKFSLLVKADAVSIGTLDHSKIAGPIDVNGSSKRRLVNQVKARFTNPNTEWSDDEVLFPDGINGGAALRAKWETADGSPLTREISLPTVTQPDLALWMASIALYERRGQTTAKTRTNLAALAYNAGDVVGLTSPLLGWADRHHRITSLSFDYARGRVDIEAIEHDSAIYARRLLSDSDLFRGTAHNNPLAVETPTNFVVASTDTIGIDKRRQFGLEVSWAAADDIASTYELRGRAATETNDGAWTTLILRDAYYQVAPLPLGSEWDLQVRAINDLGAASPWTVRVRHTVMADVTPPALPTDVSVQGGFQQLIVSWTPPPNVDLALVEIYVATMGDRPPTPDLTVSSSSQGVLAGLIDDTAYLVWLRSVDIAGNRSDPAGPYRGRTSRFGERDVGVLKREYIYRTHPTGQLRPPERAMDNWRYDQPVAPWQDNAPSLTADQPFLLRDERPVPVDVEVGDAVDGQWIGAAIIGHYGVDGTAGEDGSGVEFVYALTAAGQVGNNQMPDNNWLFDRPGLAGGLQWYDEAPDTTPARPFLVVAARRTQGFPRAGDRIADVWGRPAVQSHYGDDGVSASVGAPVIWFEQPDGSYEPAATTQDVDIRFYRGRREFAQGMVHFQRVGNGLHDSISTSTPAEVLGEFRASFGKGRRGSRVLGITATWHGLDGDETNNISITACAYIVRAGVSEERIRQLIGELTREEEQPPTQQPESQPPATTTQITQTAYRRAAAQPAAPSSTPGSYPPSGWREIRPSPTVTAAVWQSTRTVTMRNGAAVSATNWTTPTEVAAQLPPPSTQITQTAYRRAAAKPAAPTSASGSYPPSGWSETQPSPTVTAAVWQSTRTVTMRSGAAVSATNWTTPTEVAAQLPPSSTQITQTAYRRAAAKPAAPTSASGSYPPSGWSETQPSPTVTAAVWQSTRTVTMRNGAAVSATNWTTPTEVAARLPEPQPPATADPLRASVAPAYERVNLSNNSARRGVAFLVSAIDGVPPYGGTGSFTRHFTSSDAGINHESFTVTDTAGNSATTTATVEVIVIGEGEHHEQREGLAATITPPRQAILLTGPDAEGYAEFDIAASGGVPPYAGTGRWRVLHTAADAGTHEFTALVTDAAGDDVEVTAIVEIVVE